VAVAYTQSGLSHFHSSEATADTPTLAGVASGATIVAVVMAYDSGTNPAATTACKLDGTGATFDESYVGANQTGSTDRVRLEFYVWRNVSSGSHFVRVTNGCQVKTLTIIEVSGVQTTASAIATSGGAVSGSATNAPSSGALTSANSDDMWIGAWTAAASPSGASTANNSFTQRQNETDGTQWLCGAVSTRANPGSTSQTVSFSQTSGTSWWAAAGIALKAASGGGGGVTVKRFTALGVG
jgi:hypothetical protein